MMSVGLLSSGSDAKQPLSAASMKALGSQGATLWSKCAGSTIILEAFQVNTMKGSKLYKIAHIISNCKPKSAYTLLPVLFTSRRSAVVVHTI